MKLTAGTLLYRLAEGRIQVLLVHASGPYNRNAPWSIPKGVIEDGESPEQAARRETLEETGVKAGELTSLGSIDYVKSRKRIHAFAGPLLDDAVPHCASWEIDRAEVGVLDEAIALIHPDQRAFLDRLRQMLDAEAT